MKEQNRLTYWMCELRWEIVKVHDMDLSPAGEIVELRKHSPFSCLASNISAAGSRGSRQARTHPFDTSLNGSGSITHEAKEKMTHLGTPVILSF